MPSKKKNTKKKGKDLVKIHNYILIGLLASLGILIILVGIREYRFYKMNKQATDVLEAFKSLKNVEGTDIAYKKDDIKLGDFKVIGTIKIDAIGIEYPVLEKTTDESMLLSVTKLYGPNLNEIGNVSIAGHNAHNGTLFSRLSNLKLDDIIEITDLNNKTIKYKIFKTYSVLPNDLEPLEADNKDKREVTLISCIMSAKKRIIIKAVEIENK